MVHIRRRRGKILGLVGAIEAYGGALEYDLMTLAGYTLGDVGGRLPWGSFANFVEHLPPTSAYRRELAEEAGDGDMLPWIDGTLVAPVLASIADEVGIFAWQHACANRGKGPRPPRPKTARRPWDRTNDVRRYGSDPMPISEFDTWWESQDVSAGDSEEE